MKGSSVLFTIARKELMEVVRDGRLRLLSLLVIILAPLRSVLEHAKH